MAIAIAIAIAIAMASPPLPGRAVESREVTKDPAGPCHAAVDIPDAEAPIHRSDVDETTAAAAPAKEEEEEDDGSLGCAGKIPMAILCVWFIGYVLGFFVWGVTPIDEPEVLLLLGPVALFVVFLLEML